MGKWWTVVLWELLTSQSITYVLYVTTLKAGQYCDLLVNSLDVAVLLPEATLLWRLAGGCWSKDGEKRRATSDHYELQPLEARSSIQLTRSFLPLFQIFKTVCRKAVAKMDFNVSCCYKSCNFYCNYDARKGFFCLFFFNSVTSCDGLVTVFVKVQCDLRGYFAYR